jgi:hypothetical protein
VSLNRKWRVQDSFRRVSRISVKKNNHSLFGKAHYSLKDDNINLKVMVMVFNTTFKNISVILWWSVFIGGENH